MEINGSVETVVKTMTLEFEGYKKTIQFQVIENDMPENSNSKFLKRCEDDFVGTITILNGNIFDSELWFSKELRSQNKTEINKKKVNKRIVIILESPHVSEYKLEKPAPAIGTSGNNLQKYFIKIIKDFKDLHLSDDAYDVILMNAIQYQCSLGMDREKYRDRLWLTLWLENEHRDNFNERLKKYEPDVVINLCTLGGHKKDQILKTGNAKINRVIEDALKAVNKENTLKNLVQIEIGKIENRSKVFLEASHPSCWNIPEIKYVNTILEGK